MVMVVHFGGRMFVNGTIEEPGFQAGIAHVISENAVCAGVGALDCGADILVAESLLTNGAVLHVVLPFDPDLFETRSVVIGGTTWCSRYRACLNHATELHIQPHSENNTAFAAASLAAMQRTCTLARQQSADIAQIALHDGVQSVDPVSTAGDVHIWQKMGDQTIQIHVPEHLLLPAHTKNF